MLQDAADGDGLAKLRGVDMVDGGRLGGHGSSVSVAWQIGGPWDFRNKRTDSYAALSEACSAKALLSSDKSAQDADSLSPTSRTAAATAGETEVSNTLGMM